MTKIVIHGAKGRMGRALEQCARRHADLEVAGLVDLGDNLSEVVARADVVVDFSFHSATPPAAQLCAQFGKALVIGTTGHSDAERAEILAAETRIPIVWASNYSTGVNALFWLARKAAEILGPAFDVEIVEMHHRSKKDAPSGTASTLGEILAELRRAQFRTVARHGRHGITGERSAEEIGVHSLRGGDVVGDHTVIFAAPGERIEVTHRAASRETFAEGALRAARWVVGQKAGLYSMQDVLGLK